MSRPDDIPQHIERSAFKLALEFRKSEMEDGVQALALTYVIARAMISSAADEREACALEPEIVADAYEAYGAFETANEFRQVAAAIRKRSDGNVNSVRKSENQEV